MFTCDDCMYLLADYDPKFQCGERPPPESRIDGMGWFPGVELTWWCGKWAAWVAAFSVVSAGNNQTAPVGQPVALPVSVVVLNALGRPVYGAEVTFVVASGGGSITGAVASTGRDGVATLGSWILGASGAPGNNVLYADVGGLPQLVINATAEGIIISLNGGDGQVAVAGSVLPIAPSVLLTDLALNPLQGVVVNFNITDGGGSVQGSPAVSDINGIAAPVSWTLGVAPGPNALSAFSASVPTAGSPILFTATGT
jgi:adhesin/invasin